MTRSEHPSMRNPERPTPVTAAHLDALMHSTMFGGSLRTMRAAALGLYGRPGVNSRLALPQPVAGHRMHSEIVTFRDGSQAQRMHTSGSLLTVTFKTDRDARVPLTPTSDDIAQGLLTSAYGAVARVVDEFTDGDRRAFTEIRVMNSPRIPRSEIASLLIDISENPDDIDAHLALFGVHSELLRFNGMSLRFNREKRTQILNLPDSEIPVLQPPSEPLF